ncbi:selenium-binding protein 2 isoform X3 [Rosa chinensis]|uniref:selenium-binding protein 2 isoform X3 n=1 Tax=Rosa chinensis TaxID=74649 RepID=UPI001AD8B11D|nr:selenium-binding protein 2 isoform X3 [Rosa chinensis]
MMIDYVVVPVASSFGLEEDYKYLTRSMREFLTGHIYVIDTKTDPEAPSLHKVVDPEDVVQKIGLAYPHTSHCLASGDFFSLTQSLMSREGFSSYIKLFFESVCGEVYPLRLLGDYHLFYRKCPT